MTYTIAEVLSTTHHREWKPQDGAPLYFFKVKLEDGTEAEAGKKKPDTPPQVGDRYKTLRQPNNPEYLATLQGPITDYKGNGSKDFHADPKGLRSKNASSALHAAIAAVSARPGEPFTSDEIWRIADKFYAFIESKAKVGE